MGSTLKYVLLIAAAFVTQTTQAQNLRIVSLNIGHTRKGRNVEPAPDISLASLENLAGLKSVLVEIASDADNVVVGLQEVDNCLNRSDGVNQAGYFAQLIGTDWVYRFGKNIDPSCSLPEYDGHQVPVEYQSYINDCGNAGYGNAILSNVSITKTQYWKFTWDEDNEEEWGKEQRGAIAIKLKMDSHYLWFVNTHLSTNKIAAERQVWQLVGRIGTFDPSTPVIVVGDLNIKKDGYHTTEGIDWHMKNIYERMVQIFEGAGFIQVGENDGFTFTPWRDYTKVDYMFLLDPTKLLAGLSVVAFPTFGNLDFRLLNPDNSINSSLIYTDHKALILDLQWGRRIKKP